jgi:hypothetical protein
MFTLVPDLTIPMMHFFGRSRLYLILFQVDDDFVEKTVSTSSP